LFKIGVKTFQNLELQARTNGRILAKFDQRRRGRLFCRCKEAENTFYSRVPFNSCFLLRLRLWLIAWITAIVGDHRLRCRSASIRCLIQIRTQFLNQTKYTCATVSVALVTCVTLTFVCPFVVYASSILIAFRTLVVDLSVIANYVGHCACNGKSAIYANCATICPFYNLYGQN
jgi:hypothetical protein